MGEKLLADFQAIWFSTLEYDCYHIPDERTNEYYIKIRCIQFYFFHVTHNPRRDPKRFQKTFQVWPDTFDEICDLIQEDLEMFPPPGLEDLPNRRVLVQRQVTLVLLCLGWGAAQLISGELFGLTQSTTSNISDKFISSFIFRAKHFMKWPVGEDMVHVKQRFKEKCSFANCCGAIDGTHFIITKPPREDSVDYFDRNRNLSVSMQAVIDYDGRFLNVSIGWPRSYHDSRMLYNTHFYQAVQYRGTKLNGPNHQLQNGTLIREYILGDGNYPCTPWLVVPFPRNQGVKKRRFNKRLSSGRMAMERAFAYIKNKFKILDSKMNRSTPDRIYKTIYTCCLLHNTVLVGPQPPDMENVEGSAHLEGYAGVFEFNWNVMDQSNPTRAHLFTDLLAVGALNHESFQNTDPASESDSDHFFE